MMVNNSKRSEHENGGDGDEFEFYFFWKKRKKTRKWAPSPCERYGKLWLSQPLPQRKRKMKKDESFIRAFFFFISRVEMKRRGLHSSIECQSRLLPTLNSSPPAFFF